MSLKLYAVLGWVVIAGGRWCGAEPAGVPSAKWSSQLQASNNYTGVLWDNSPAEQFYLCPGGSHLYLLTYTSLYKFNATNLFMEKKYETPYVQGEGFLSLAETSNCLHLAVYKMPGKVLLLDPTSLLPLASCKLEIANYIAHLKWSPDNNDLFALGDQGILARLKFERGLSVVSKLNLEGRRPMSWDISGGKLYVTFSDINSISRFGATHAEPLASLKIISPSDAPANANSKRSLSLNRIAIDSVRGRVFVQKVRSPGVSPPNDILLTLNESSGQIMQQTNIPIGLLRLQISWDNQYLFFGQNGKPRIIRALNLDTLQTSDCIAFDGNDFLISPFNKVLYLVKYTGSDAQVSMLRLVPPTAATR